MHTSLYHKRMSRNEFLSLQEGRTRFEISGQGPRVVLIHGMTAPLHVWDPTVKALNEAGFQTLRYDLFGRGDSDRPKKAYTLDLLYRQLTELLEKQKTESPLHLIAFSWGCGLAAYFTDRHPDRVRKMIFLAPGGLPHLYQKSFGIMKTPLLGEVILGLFGNRSLLQDTKKTFLYPERFPEFYERFQKQLKRPGYGRAFLSTLRNTPSDFTKIYRDLGQRRKEILLLWGKEDRKVPVENAVRFEELLPGATTLTFDDAGHAVHWDRQEEVDRAIQTFLS